MSSLLPPSSDLGSGAAEGRFFLVGGGESSGSSSVSGTSFKEDLERTDVRVLVLVAAALERADGGLRVVEVGLTSSSSSGAGSFRFRLEEEAGLSGGGTEGLADVARPERRGGMM